ncbi:MAG: ferredoxin III, nif-specific [Candidatus Thiodiazotropha lotti]|uniref:Ferredoxin III n=1 Tax=Candidatus Thiodiazotropha endoloripes TaxID=1818881 RepID=A0A1E2UTB5_9GAMM|nr:ferredoxin III, nif-specific [Candidatus Thiodiazotropha endoloripes]MBV2092722.1 ferredoxin III, nif-specific [Candidatus Thiodiazotropha taylori]MCG7900170.1 ferredoxin III, nif-specific [Candidatus Thiodiazotropha weberae]MCG7990683.1 ferredoxin III, nif-specific [Candidatus Thiodiazotropha lotti]MCG7901323.1 ferredoxin III, nif-specific [Candidatus Thiodiazotropha weberae]MCG7915801.1 ferredoxin III, nif-specific [Candidatus Thiodiazotropha weberae]
MSVITGLTRGGEEYTPAFVMEINQQNCIGCGRCFKVCPRDVFDLIDREDVEGLLDDDDDYDDDYGDDDDGFSDDTAMVMSLKNSMDCIGCGSCARICPKQCFTHQPQTAAA